MKFCRFLPHATGVGRKPSPSWGVLEPDGIREITGPPWATWTHGNTVWTLKAARLLPPCEPSKIVCVGRNYAAHAAELGNEMPKEPLIFLKPPSAIVGPDDPILLPTYSNRVEHEGELGAVIGKICSHLKDDDDPLSYVLGYTCVNDVTARDLQKADVQFTRAKGFDTFCPVGPHIETQLDPRNVLVECRVNGERRQSGSTSLMAYPVASIVRWISQMMTLLPGDLIATGTPAGVGPLVAGDTVEVSAAGIGVLRNPVHAMKS
ncbi:MAG TPA: fumarylacetoacetate hydrolase family protein [Methylomirabilota bacterium]|nr:fumarylacetoacetate hydrolase family protein [Methylomirabilota bacterium]